MDVLPGALHPAAQRQALLIPRLRLDVERSVRRELHPRQVVVLGQRPVEPLGALAGDVHHAQLHLGVRAAGEGIALGDHANAVGIRFLAVGLRDGRGVHPREGDGAVVRRPPVALEAVHFLLRDEVRQAVRDRSAAIAGESRLHAAGDVSAVEIAATDVAQALSGGGQADGALPRIRRREPLHGSRRHAQQERGAIGREENLVASRMPGVRPDAVPELAPPLALVPVLFGGRPVARLANRSASRFQRRRFVAVRVLRFAIREIDQPQFLPFAVVLGGKAGSCRSGRPPRASAGSATRRRAAGASRTGVPA